MTLGLLPGSARSTARKHAIMAGFMRRLAVTDLLVVIWAVLGAQVIRFGTGEPTATLPAGIATFDARYTGFSVALIVTWLFMLRIHGAYDSRLLGHGPEEYRAVAGASFRLFSVVAVTSYVLRLEVARGYVAIALPAGMLGLMLSRWLWRKWLTLHRAQGELSSSVLVVGGHDHLVGLIRTLASVPEAGYHVVAACCSDTHQREIGGVPVVGDEMEAAEIAVRIGVDTVACTSSSSRGSDGLRRLSWALEGKDVDLVVAPSLTDVAGPRVLTRPCCPLCWRAAKARVRCSNCPTTPESPASERP